ncbi:hypothetical protein GGI42DRAFT_154237 [Trichoderma sp. SZMC 28013]
MQRSKRRYERGRLGIVCLGHVKMNTRRFSDASGLGSQRRIMPWLVFSLSCVCFFGRRGRIALHCLPAHHMPSLQDLRAEQSLVDRERLHPLQSTAPTRLYRLVCRELQPMQCNGSGMANAFAIVGAQSCSTEGEAHIVIVYSYSDVERG